MLNQISMAGRIVAEPVYKETDKYKLCRFKIACDRDYKEGGEKKTDFVQCTAFGSAASFVQMACDKGDLVIVSGRLQIDEDTENHKSYTSIKVENAYPVTAKKDKVKKEGAPKQSRFEELNGEDEGQLPF